MAGVKAYRVIAMNPSQPTTRREAAFGSAAGCLSQSFVNARQARVVEGNSDNLFTEGSALNRKVNRGKRRIPTEKLGRLIRQGATAPRLRSASV